MNSSRKALCFAKGFAALGLDHQVGVRFDGDQTDGADDRLAEIAAPGNTRYHRPNRSTQPITTETRRT